MIFVNPVAARSIQGAMDPANKLELTRKALKDFEQYFVYMLLKEMQATVPDDGLFPGGFERDTYMDMMADGLAENVAVSGKLGLAQQLETQLRLADLERQTGMEQQGNVL